MLLKSLEIQGFKSFADKVFFSFAPGVTAIVGPNGSGKSNVVDAIRWVLGEQSAKSLRGEKMEDIIFSGSVDRKPVGMAKVTMILDNSQRLFAMDCDEVEVSRVLYRSGESNYMLNKSTCRLKDVQELFMDTGLGKDGFSVIGQGKVEEILTLHAEERRGLIEEAAGISKYKYRKKEAERKLEATEEDMTRLDDILYELEKRMDPLAEQAEKVRVYRKLKAEEEKLQLSHLTKQYLSTQNEIGASEKNISNEKASATEAQVKLNQIEADISEEKFKLDEKRQAMEVLQNEFNQAFRNTQTYEKDLSVYSERHQHHDERLTALEKESLLNQTQLETNIQQSQELSLQVEQSTEVMATADANVAEARERLQQSEDVLATLKLELNNLQESKLELLGKQSQVNNDMVRIQETINGGSARKNLLEDKLKDLEEENNHLLTTLSTHQEEKTGLQKEEALLQEKLARYREQQETLNRVSKDLNAKEKMLNQQLMQAKSRLETLKDFEASGEGYFQGVKAILRAKKDKVLSGIEGSVLQLLEIPAEYLIAIENALGGAAQNVVVENDMDAQKAISWLKKERSGRVTFMPINLVRGKRKDVAFQDDAVIGLALDLVRYDAKYQVVLAQLLGRVWILKDLESATRLSKRTGAQYRFVTLDGDVISPGGTMTGGHVKKQNSIVYRKQEMNTLKEKIAALENQQAKLLKELDECDVKLESDAKEIQSLQAELQENQLKLREVDVMLDQLGQQQEKIQNDIKSKERSGAELKKDDATAQNTLEQLNEKALAMHQTLEEMEYKLQGTKNDVTAYEAEVQGMQQKLQAVLIEQVSVQNQHQALTLSYNESLMKQATLESDLATQNTEKLALTETKQALNEKIASLKDLLQQSMVLYQEKDQAIKVGRQEVQQMELGLSGRDKEIAQLRKENEKLWGIYNASTMKMERLQEKLQQIEQKIFEIFSFSPQEAIAEADLELDTNGAAEQLKTLKQKIKNLGEINFTALEEYESVSEQVYFLREQIEDLVLAKEKLSTVIQEMESTMSQRFKDAYEKVNAHFSEIFKLMFNGGHARLELSLPGRYLETGVEIIAQPPGKKERVLTLLSGGERALTATALLFSLLEVRPSPFVILDEIEAALDEANVERFASFIEQYAYATQFIIISHRKGTMEAASVLYGITMDAKGVSKQISVRLEDLNKEKEA